MHYATIFKDEETEIEVVETAPGQYDVMIADAQGGVIRVDARRVKNTTWSFIIDDVAYNIEFEVDATSESGRENLLVRGETIPIEVVDLRKLQVRRAREETGEPVGPAEIRSPMPGKIVAVLVEEGQDVSAGDGLVVVEAMKMENELRAPKNGVVRNLDLQIGVGVEAGTVLCVVD